MGTNTTHRTVRSHVVIGGRDQVYAALDRARADGRLVAVTEARVLPGDRLRLVARLRTPSGARSLQSRWERVRPWLLGAVKVLGVLAAVAGVAALVWAIVWVVMAVVALIVAAIAWMHAHLLTIGLVAGGLLALMLLLGTAGGGCGGMHCGGCRR